MPPNPRGNISLIGMPGVGKSTVGVLLAKATGRDFLDTDILLQTSERRALQAIIDADGLEGFCRLEEACILRLKPSGVVIATGGSAVYSEEAMRRLKAAGPVVWLELPIAELKVRLRNLSTRGVVMPRDQSVEELYAARLPLYQHWADLTVNCVGLTTDQVVWRITRALGEEPPRTTSSA